MCERSKDIRLREHSRRDGMPVRSGNRSREREPAGCRGCITLLGEGELPPLDSLARDLKQKLDRPVEVTVHLIPETSMKFPPG